MSTIINKKECLEKVLKNYNEILDQKQTAKFQILKKKKLLQPRVKKAYKIMENCTLCHRRCQMDRINPVIPPFCQTTSKKIDLSGACQHFGEEFFLVPSYTVFFMGCNLECVFCQNWEISQRYSKGTKIEVKDLEDILERGGKKSKNINLVGGEPTPHLPQILDALQGVKVNVPVVWNSNFYFSKETRELLKDCVDIYLSDWKFGRGKCASRLSWVWDYWKVCSKNHDFAFKDATLIIRHLIMPKHVECCSLPIIDYVAKNYGDKVIMNLMAQYRPEFLAKKGSFEDINRKPTEKELKKVWDYAKKKGICFVRPNLKYW